MKRHRYILYALASTAIFGFFGCSSKDDLSNADIQYDLVGKAVTFNPSVESIMSRAINHDGFNNGDIINIYPSYGTTGGSFKPETNWVQYQLNQETDAGGHVISSKWEVNTTALKYRSTVKQTLADTISWSNTDPVRFRAWGKSSISNYNDYLFADFSSVAGPTQSVPLVFKHLGCRIGFTPRVGNIILKINVCTDAKYYTDETGGLTAQQQVDNVKAIWNQTCVPGGIEMYSNCDNDGYTWGTTTDVDTRQPDYGVLMAQPATGTSLVRAKQYTSANIPTNTARPAWNSIEGIFYTIVCPYELSSDNYGNLITLPPYTRFEVYIYDVNNGDAANTTKYEGDCHTFALRDVKKDNVAIYADGMTLQSNYSYMFTVGYYYDQLTVTPADSFAWTTVNSGSFTGNNNQPTSSDADYLWWQDAINTAADAAYASSTPVADISPVFNISTVSQWKAFVNIVNGNLPTGGLSYYKFTPQNGQTPKSIDRSAKLTTAFNFENYTVNIANDIDFMDESIASVGTEANPFKGSLNGGFHSFKNTNFVGGYVFGYVNGINTVTQKSNGSTIGYVKINSTKNTTVVQDASSTSLKAIYMTCPSLNALALKAVSSTFIGCAHIGTGLANGPLVGETNSDKNSLTSCFIAAANNGYVGGGTSATTWERCYYDKTLTPSTSLAGYDQTDNNYIDCKLRGVLSSILKAKDNYLNPMSTSKYDLYYGGAPWLIMNGALTDKNFHFELPTRYGDQYPVLVSGAPTADQYIMSIPKNY